MTRNHVASVVRSWPAGPPLRQRPQPAREPSGGSPAAPSPSAPPSPVRPGAPPASVPAPGGAALPRRASSLEPPPLSGEQVAPSEAPPTRPSRSDPAATAAPPRHSSGKTKSARATAVAGRGVRLAVPSSTTTALKNELRQSLSAPTEVVAPVSDRTRLEQLASEITQAREALRQETTRLEALIKQRGSCDGEAHSLPGESSPSAAVSRSGGKGRGPRAARKRVQGDERHEAGTGRGGGVASGLPFGGRGPASHAAGRRRGCDGVAQAGAGGGVGHRDRNPQANLSQEGGLPMKVTAAVIAQAEAAAFPLTPAAHPIRVTTATSPRPSTSPSASRRGTPLRPLPRCKPRGERRPAKPRWQCHRPRMRWLPCRLRHRTVCRTGRSRAVTRSPRREQAGTIYTFDRRATTGRDPNPRFLDGRHTVAGSGSASARARCPGPVAAASECPFGNRRGQADCDGCGRCPR